MVAAAPAAHVALYGGTEVCQDVRGDGVLHVLCGVARELGGKQGVVKSAVLALGHELAAVVQQGGGEAEAVHGGVRLHAMHAQQVLGHAVDAAGVQDEATLQALVGMVVFAAGACWCLPEGGRCGKEGVSGEFAEPLVGDGVNEVV